MDAENFEKLVDRARGAKKERDRARRAYDELIAMPKGGTQKDAKEALDRLKVAQRDFRVVNEQIANAVIAEQDAACEAEKVVIPERHGARRARVALTGLAVFAGGVSVAPTFGLTFRHLSVTFALAGIAAVLAAIVAAFFLMRDGERQTSARAAAGLTGAAAFAGVFAACGMTATALFAVLAVAALTFAALELIAARFVKGA